MTTTPPPADELRAVVREKYAAIARGETVSCCGDTIDASEVLDMIGDAYDGVDGYLAEADLKLGCGLPVEHAGLNPGHTVLDLGSGAGLDAFVARQVVGDAGHVIGVDFVAEMLTKARSNAATLGYSNVEFVEGTIEELPLADASVDVIISNCVLNLVPDKERAFAEMRRVLRPGGHFCVSDIVSRGTLPPSIRRSAELHAGCVAGAIPECDYLELLRAVGFADVEVVESRRLDIPEAALPPLTDDEREALQRGGLWSVTVRGLHPASVSDGERVPA